MPLTESRADFHDTDEFSTAATYTPAAGGSSSAVEGIFDTTWVDPLGQLEGYATVYRAWLSDFTDPKKGDTLVIGAVTYKARIVKRNEPTPGEVLFVLEKQ